MGALQRFAGVSLVICLATCAPPSQEAAPEAPPPRGTVMANGIEFEYFIEGTGRDCLVIGDALTPSRSLSAALRQHFRFVFLSSRMTTPEEQVGDISNVTMDTLVDDIEQARQTLGLGNVCVLGHSISGILALEYARKYPEHTTHAIMHGTPPFVDERTAPAVADFWEANADAERRNALEESWAAVPPDSLAALPPGEASILEYITNAPRYFHDPSYDPAWLFEGAYWNQPAWDQLFDVIMASYDLGRAPRVEVPVFLALGRSDFAVPFTMWDGEREKIPNLSYHLFDRSGHYPMLEEQELFDLLLLEWIAG